MGSYDGAEICKLVGLFILNQLTTKYEIDSIEHYRDDGIASFELNLQKHHRTTTDRIRKDITK